MAHLCTTFKVKGARILEKKEAFWIQFPERLVYCLINRSRLLYSYAKDIFEDIGYKGYNIKIFFLLILIILIRTPFDSDFKIVPLPIL